jgi:hypothetical protein
MASSRSSSSAGSQALLTDDDALTVAEGRSNDNEPSLLPLAEREWNSRFIPAEGDVQVADDGEPFRHLEIYGLSEYSNGRSCEMHQCCGEQVKVGDVLRLQKCVIDTHEGEVEESIACILIRHASETCRVAFIPRVFHNSPLVLQQINKHVQVSELYKESNNTAKRRKNHLNCGVGGVVFLNLIPQME